ncbi:hypothetical protein ACJMK2_032058 [Sinanodonta woodiana]|uniref:P2X purinoreceptor 7 intracellular domain-containing protein n=1 Tax=Sinanodonta woodiana TaxID=1069815 RepID=A0ABD3X415_SINWO
MESGGRGRGRVTRQRRGKGNQGPSLSRTKVALTAEARDHQLKVKLIFVSFYDILARICQKHPNMVFELIDSSSTEQQGYHPRPGGESPSWCLCNNCREMPTDEEKLLQTNRGKLLFKASYEVVLLVAQRYRQDVLATEEDDNYNRGKRHAAYRQFILWTFGYLGAGNRRAIPGCCVWRIRDKYPDSFSQYRGFIQGRLG